MLRFGKQKPIAEHEAEGEIERVYHEIRQVLRVSGVNLNFRTWATFEKFLPAMWDAMRSNLETRAFEDAADKIRADAVTAAVKIRDGTSAPAATIGESQRFQVQAALSLYHYVNPKLLVLTSVVRLALDGEQIGGSSDDATPERIELGEPPRMFPMEMAPEEPEDERLQELFDDIKTTLDLPSINSDYRTLALWPEYLGTEWRSLKPLLKRAEYRAAADELRNNARALARELPLPVALTSQRVEELGGDAAAVVEKTERFERLLPELILNIALLQLRWHAVEALRASPFPADTRRAQEVSR